MLRTDTESVASTQADVERADAASLRVGHLLSGGAKELLGVREKDEILRNMEEMQRLMAETDQMTLQIKRRVA